jgi:O-6-methylguanine DNA methyltransferase
MTTLASVKVTAYQERVYALLLQIPPGRISSYASLSKALGSSPRAVGGALRNNPFAPEVPCHRVISASGVSLLSSHILMPHSLLPLLPDPFDSHASVATL